MVELRNVQRVRRIDTRGLRRYAQRILEILELGESTLSLLLTDDCRMTELHGRWMDDPTPTDVLSFPANGGEGPATGSGRPLPCSNSPRPFLDKREGSAELRAASGGPSPVSPPPPYLLGDIAISVETAARRKPKDVEGEIEQYLLHGILHLAGYDHVRPQEKRRMQQKARRLQAIFRRMG